MQCKMPKNIKIFVPVAEECMGFVIGPEGRDIKQIKHETQTRISNKSCNGIDLEGQSGFTVIGSRTNCEAARQAIIHRAVSIPYTPYMYIFVISQQAQLICFLSYTFNEGISDQ